MLRLLDVTSMILIYISALIGGVAGGWMVPVNTSIQADNTTYVQYKTGKRAEAAIASLTSFVSKVAQGLGGAIPGYVIAAYGFVTGSVAQPESINTGIILCVLILPTILTAAGAILFGTQYTLDKKAVEEMHTAIAARSNK
ncbi:MFS transporter [Enterococcus casseliflavus]|uniref:MFS transporter n=1 Tax=Enterococcus casseliflavus TaxID=37734 RepID=UPI0039A77B76